MEVHDSLVIFVSGWRVDGESGNVTTYIFLLQW